MTGRVFQLVKSVPRLVLSISAVLAVAPAFAADTPAKPVTFAKDVAPIFQAKCQECHQPGSIAPMSLITFQDVRPWARSIKERVATRQMPPVHQDVWYRPMADLPITEPRWAKMVEIRPLSLKARRTIHHSIAYLMLNNDPDAVNTGTANGPDRGRFQDDDLVNRRPQLMEWAIGKGYDLFRPGTGKLLLPGEKIAWDQHIHAVGEEIASGSEIGIWLYKKGEEPKK